MRNINHTIHITSKSDFLTFEFSSIFQEERDRRRKQTLTGEQVSSKYSEELVKSVKAIDERPDCLMPEQRFQFNG